MTGVQTCALPISRASDTAWEANDEIGVFVKNPSSNGIFLNTNVLYYTPDASGKFEAVSEKIYYPEDEMAVDYIAYYPYSKENVTEGLYKFDLSSDAELSRKDLMYAMVPGHSQSDGAVPFRFSHMLSKIIVELKSETSILSGASVSINNQCNVGILDLSSGSISAASEATYNNELVFEEKESSGEYQVIVMPSAQTVGRDIMITLNGKTYMTSLDPTYSYASGYKYTYTITLKGIEDDPENVEIIITQDINDWTGGHEGSLEGNDNIPDVSGKTEHILISSITDLSESSVNINKEQLNGLALEDVICLYYQKDITAESKIFINKNNATRAINSYEYTLTAGTTAGRIGITIENDEILNFFSNDLTITGEDIFLSCLSVYSNTLNGNVPDESDVDPVTDKTIMIIDFEPSDDHNAGWDNSWSDGSATEPQEENGNTFMRLVKGIGDGWIFNCNHKPIQTVSNIENYILKFDIRIDEGVTGASLAEGQYVIADNWLWVGTDMFPETTNGKWITVSRKISDLNGDLTGDLVFAKDDGGIQGSGLYGKDVPAGISFDNLRLDPIE